MGTSPTSGQLSESEEKHLRLRVKQLICGSLNRMRIRQSLLQPYIPRTGRRSSIRSSSWELKFGDCGAIPGRGLLLTSERRIKRMSGRRLVGNTCGGKPGSHGGKARILLSHAQRVEPSPQPLSPHASIGRGTTERLARQTPDALNSRAGPHPECSFKCLMRRSAE